jgi:hypothetical protein
MPRGVKGSSDTPQRVKWAARSRAYYAKNKEGLSWASNAWNRAHVEEGRERSRAWGKKNPERARQKRNEWNHTNRARSRATKNAWYAKHPGYNAAMSTACIRRQQEKEAGRKKPKRCDVCKIGGRRICFDHCHKSDLFRGWLCSNCNFILGYTKDSSKTLRKLVLYLAQKPSKCVVIDWPLKSKKRLRLLGPYETKCQACSSTERICIDHCHKTKLFRGWLCNGCNAALGHAHDSIKLLLKLADYLDADKLKQKGLKKNAKKK